MKKFYLTGLLMGIALTGFAKEVKLDSIAVEPSRTLLPIPEEKQTLELRDSTRFVVPFAWANKQVVVRIGEREWNVTSHVEEGMNELVASDSTATAHIFSTPAIHVRDVFTRTTRVAHRNEALIGVVIKTEALNPKKSRIMLNLLRPDGTEAFYDKRDIALEMRGEDTLRFITTIPDSMLWHPERPTLYTLRLRNRIEGRIAETIEISVGFRTLCLRDSTLLLNGAPLTEIPDSLTKFIPIDTSAEGLSRKKEGNSSNDPTQLERFLSAVRHTFYTTQLDPSVLVYSLTSGDSANGINLYESYLLLKRLAGERPVVYPWAAGEWNGDPVALQQGRSI